MVCSDCSQQMNSEARFCCHCGRPVAAQASQNFRAVRLTRPRQGRMISGVCAGIAQAYGLDPVIVRLLTVVIFFCGFGSIFIAYIAAWVIMPNEPLFYAPQNFTNYPPATAGSAQV